MFGVEPTQGPMAYPQWLPPEPERHGPVLIAKSVKRFIIF